MALEEPTVETFDRLLCASLTGILASNPGGAFGKKPDEWANYAAQIAVASVLARDTGLNNLEVALRTRGAPAVPAPTVQYSAAVPIRQPPLVQPPGAFTPTAATPGALPAAGGTSAADSRASRLGVSPDMCPVCKGPRNEATKNADPQCPFFHFVPFGQVPAPIAPPEPPTPAE